MLCFFLYRHFGLLFSSIVGVLLATLPGESLEFLKSHAATYLMLTQRHPPEVFLQGELSDAFVPVYPMDDFTEAYVKVWQIHYPPDIQSNPKYLATEPGE